MLCAAESTVTDKDGQNKFYLKGGDVSGRDEVKRNPLGIKVFVVGKPDIEHMTEDEYVLFVSSLEMRMNEYLEKTKESK